jgi:hypothetical protein
VRPEPEVSTRQPLRGYNHNVRHLDMVFHIQTEDSGVRAPHIFTHCFHEGTIVATKKRDYPADAAEEVVRSAMKEQHKELMRELKHGVYDAKIRQYFGAGGPVAVAGPEGADAAAAAVVAEAKKAAYERLLAEAKDLDSALEMELVADEPPPAAAPGADASEWPGPSEGARLPTGPEWPGPSEGAKLPPIVPAAAAAPATAATPMAAAAAAAPPSSPTPTGVAEPVPGGSAPDWSSVRAALASLGVEEGDAGLAVATYLAGDLSGPVSVVTFNESAAGQSVKPIDLGALPPGHTLPPAPKPRSEHSIWALKMGTEERPLERSGPITVPPSVTAVGPGTVPPERVEPWPVTERVAVRESETLPEPPAVVFHPPGAPPAAPTPARVASAAPTPAAATPAAATPAATAHAPMDLRQPPGVSPRAPARTGLPEPPGVSLRAPAAPAATPDRPSTQRAQRSVAQGSAPARAAGVPPPLPAASPPPRPPGGPPPIPAPERGPTERGQRLPPGARMPTPPSVSLRPSVPPPMPSAPPVPSAAPTAATAAPSAGAARPATGTGIVRPPARPAGPASDGHSVSMPSRTVPPAAWSEPVAPPLSQPVVVLKPPAPPAKAPAAPTSPQHPSRQYVSVASADGVVMARPPVMVGGPGPGAARAGTRPPPAAPAAVRTPAAPAGRPAVPVLPTAARAPVATRPIATGVPPGAAAPGAGGPGVGTPPAPAPAGPPPLEAAAPPTEGESIFGTSPASEKSLHEIILSYLSGEDKPK